MPPLYHSRNRKDPFSPEIKSVRRRFSVFLRFQIDAGEYINGRQETRLTIWGCFIPGLVVSCTLRRAMLCKVERNVFLIRSTSCKLCCDKLPESREPTTPFNSVSPGSRLGRGEWKKLVFLASLSTGGSNSHFVIVRCRILRSELKNRLWILFSISLLEREEEGIFSGDTFFGWFSMAF